MVRQGLLCGSALILISLTAEALPSTAPAFARVAAVQPPVWVERAGATAALAVGAPLYEGDRYFTGPGARLHISLVDASTVKLGENAEFSLPVLALKRADADAPGFLKGALKVLKGAFRFTTSALGKLKKREIEVSIGPTITAGIRGTDIWGKSDPEQELLCLLEGQIEIGSPGHATQVMDQARTFYVVPHGKNPLPVAPAPDEKLEKWVPQTELRPDEAALLVGGAYKVGLSSSANRAAAETEVMALAVKGYAAEVMAADVQGRMRYRVVLSGLASLADATRYAELMKQRLGYKTPWVINDR